MSAKKTIPQVAYDYSGVIVSPEAPALARQTGLSQADLLWLYPRLDAARQEVLRDIRTFWEGGRVPEENLPLDAAFFDAPEQMLNEHRELLDQILAAGDRLAKEVDRVIVLGIGGSYMGAGRSWNAAAIRITTRCRGSGRGGRPRIYFEGNNVDNDAMQSLLDLVDGDDNWGIIVISKSGGTLETAVAFRVFLESLRKSCGDDEEKLRRRVLVVTGKTGRLRDLANALGCRDVFPIPEGVGGRFSILTAVGLLPAAVMGLDVLRLLEGAVAMNERFRTAPPLQNPALDYAGVSRLMETRRGATIRVLSTWGKGLEAVGLWYDQLLSESLGKNGLGATPISVVNTRDLHSRGQQHQEGRRDKLITNLIAEHTHRDPLAIKRSNFDQDNLNSLSGKTVPDILSAAFVGANKAYADDFRRTATIRLPRLDEASLGQLFQMLMIATVVEGRLVGINPYGQPGVEAYKKNMNAILRGK